MAAHVEQLKIAAKPKTHKTHIEAFMKKYKYEIIAVIVGVCVPLCCFISICFINKRIAEKATLDLDEESVEKVEELHIGRYVMKKPTNRQRLDI